MRRALLEIDGAYDESVTWLYAIGCGDFIKVGISNSIARRLRTIEAVNPFPLTVLLRRSMPARHARTVEMDVHRLLSTKRFRGEWFTVTLPEVRIAVAEAMAAMQRRERRRLREKREVTSQARASSPPTA
jgi:hypothetical protein